MREDGLNCSEKMLAADTNSFINFFNEIKAKTTEAKKELEGLKQQKNSKTNELRLKSEKYSQTVSNINKNIEFLSVFYDYKVFLDQLMPKEQQTEILKRKLAKMQEQVHILSINLFRRGKEMRNFGEKL